MKKFTGRYTTNTAKALKGSERILCQVTEAANITTHLRALGVECKPIFTPDDCHVNFIAVFSLGSTTAQRINEIARKADLCVLFQCPTH